VRAAVARMQITAPRQPAQIIACWTVRAEERTMVNERTKLLGRASAEWGQDQLRGLV